MYVFMGYMGYFDTGYDVINQQGFLFNACIYLVEIILYMPLQITFSITKICVIKYFA